MNWYLVQAKPNRHFIAATNLRKQGFEVFLPLITKTTRKAGKFVKKTTPLFPSYLFMGTISEKISWKSINSTRGVSKAVTLGNTYRSINTRIIDGLRNRCDNKDIIKNGLDVISGDRARIAVGPFSNFICEVQNIEENQRVWVLIEILQRKIHTKIALKDISKLP